MNKVDRWLLPDGIEDMLPNEAMALEALRRQLVDVFQGWGYDYVIPPLVEFTDSLFTGAGSDVELGTFKITDQISGKTMGIRADITPQAARMDAHSMHRKGVNRLCYAGHVLHTRSKSLLGSRAPVQLGVELFGVSSIQADIEVISLLVESLRAAGLEKIYLDLGHVSVYRAIVAEAGFSADQEQACFELLQAKSATELGRWLEQTVDDTTIRNWLLQLPKLSGGRAVLDTARQVYRGAPAAIEAALQQIDELAAVVVRRYPEVQLYFDLSELRGYHYHTGLVFGAFSPGVGEAIANGGRYDEVGRAFGNARPATGFNIDLSAVARIVQPPVMTKRGIFAPMSNNPEQWRKIQALRLDGERVVGGLDGQTKALDYQVCDRILVERDGEFAVQPIPSKHIQE
ncbi:MAG: ATP phosphoribosyltransferase regulatory subunit [Cellvibrionaceae bacterium]|nr:ATP phosphoribosyltransferase regulatory subunit [Cellvibrionaceae bacterium]